MNDDADTVRAQANRPARILVSTYAYNEHVKIEKTIQRIFDADLAARIPNSEVEVILADDGSTDDFPEQLQRKYGFTLLRKDRNRGIGHSIRAVIKYGWANSFDILVIMAGNNKDEPLEIPRLVEPILRGDADFVQGSRYLPGGNYGAMPLYRRIATQFVHPWYVWLLTGCRLHDTTNGFRAIRLEILKSPRFQLDQPWLDRYAMEYYILYHVLTGGFRWCEVPV
ncbi:MAG: glycosyltransferase family 2 protein, partial [Candidatus Sumerlaeaceae bacterium]